MALHTKRPSMADARLKSRLQGVGGDGGFLTSPMSSLKGSGPLRDASTVINIEGPSSEDLEFDFAGFGLDNGTGLGMDLAASPVRAYNDPLMRIYGVPKENDPSQLAFVPYPDNLPAQTVGRGKKNMRDVGPLDLPPASPMIHVDLAPSIVIDEVSSVKKNRKGLAVKISGPSTPRSKSRKPSAAAVEPLTPTMDSLVAFDAFEPIKVPFNTPAHNRTLPRDNTMPFSFGDLYSYGLVEGSTFDLNEMPSPVPGFRTLGTLEADAADAFLGSPLPSAGLLPGFGDQMFDLSFMQSLPTPALDNNLSLLSSPTSAWSASPMLSPAGSYTSTNESHSPLDMYSAFPFIPTQPSTQPFVDFASLPDPTFQNEDTPKASRSSPTMPQSPLQQMRPSCALDAIASLDDLDNLKIPFVVERPALRKKRSRMDFEADEDEAEDEVDDYVDDVESADSDYAPAQMMLQPPVIKKQRIVSAPAIRRLKPGPRPKQQQGFDGRRSVSAGPAPAELIAAAVRHLGSDNEQEISDNDQEEGSSVPKSVIRSLYSTLPANIAGKTGKKYRCLIEGCNRIFPRKSAIESHIQTHLEDKPFICSHGDCKASFVRQHDLRRHERIHSGSKPFPCPCGKGFARGDALMRHRQRGICIGSTVPRRC